VITFYTRPDCPLCGEAEMLLDEMSRHFSCSVRKIDITTDMDAFERYRHRIPVIKLGDGWDISGKISPIELKQKIQDYLQKRK
jgi:glutaredoxin